MSELISDFKIIEQISLKVVEASPDAKIVINKKGEIVIFNAQAEFMFGYDRSEVIGQKLSMLLPENVRNQHDKHLEYFFNNPKQREMGEGRELNGRNRDGELFSVQIKLAPIIVADGGLHGLAVVRRVGK